MMNRTTRFDPRQIEPTVPRHLVCSHLLPDEIERLDQPLVVGDGLTKCTYWQWIQSRAKRLFLILADLGLPDQIFGLVDRAWEDVDLPIALDQVDRLCLTATKDFKADRRFFERQFYYLLRPLDRGEHIDYQDEEIVPLNVFDKRPCRVQSSDIERVGLPNVAGQVFCRRRFPIGSHPGCLSREDLMFQVSSVRDLQHDHIVSYGASYTHRGFGYVLFTPVSDYKLSAYLASTPPSLKSLDKMSRRRLVLDWILCLVDTLGYVHSRGRWLGNIKPSTILFTHRNHILFSGPSPLSPDATSSQGAFFDKASYDYAAPERWSKPGKHGPAPRTKPSVPSKPHHSDHMPPRSCTSGHTEHGTLPATSRADPSARLGPQAADIFSLGCVILELLSHGLFKRSTGAFAAHRSARHKNAGRGGAVLDSSFHKNLGQVEGWMAALAREASKKADGSEIGQLFTGVAPLLQLVEAMLSHQPADRPSAFDAQRHVYQILTQACGITEPHCVHQYDMWDVGLAGTSTSRNSVMTTIEDTQTPEEITTTSAVGETATIASSSDPSTFYEHEDDDDLDGITVDFSTSGSISGLDFRSGSSPQGIVGRSDHRWQTSGDSSNSKDSGQGQDHNELWELSGGLKAIQNLRINKSGPWQAS